MFDKAFPKFMYVLRDFREVARVENVDETMRFDIIGKVVSMQSAQSKEIGGRNICFIDITLEDLENNRLTCTLWEEYVDRILPYLEDHGFQPIIVILQMCRAKIFRDEVNVTNSFDVTKMIVNGDDEEIQEFRKRIRTSNNETHSISHITVPSSRTVADDLASGEAPIRTIEELYSSKEVGSFWVCATVISLFGEWWYLSCKKCPKKLTKAGEKFYCECCDAFYTSGNFRYRMQLQVVDQTGNASFLCWDRDFQKLIGIPCSELRKSLTDINDGDIPDELANVLEKQVFFKLQVRSDQINNFEGAFSVVKLTTNSDLIKAFGNPAFEREESDFFSKLQAEE